MAPLLKPFPAASQFWFLMALFFVGISLFSILAALAAVPFLGIESVEDLRDLPALLSNYNDPKMVNGLRLMQTISALGTFVIPALVFAWMVSSKRMEYLGLIKGINFKQVVLAVLIIIVALPLINLLAAWNSQLSLPESMQGIERWMRNTELEAAQLVEAFLQMNSLTDLFLNLFVIAFLAALGEELFFRGAMQKVLSEWTKNPHWGIWITAFLFSLLHIQFLGFVPRLLLGALLGYLYWWSGSLWLPMIVHFVNNGFAVVLSYLSQRGLIQEGIEDVGNESSDWLYVVLSLALTAGLIFLFRKITPTPTRF